ncbi:Rha family transcriptional regulator [Metasolibacillus meyeri]|uniref:Rha family transcriptional regulator n=1 Tax=Metasolibacillus meyeri TaxID=1071052 RepID=UPI000D309282|nr:Rha family transcriptional regulator [Metasolibacillus meyeri]
MNQLPRNISSLEVAEMVGRDHKNVMRDIATILSQLDELKIEPISYFVESEYKDSLNRSKPCYLLTKQGCELYGNRMTGVDGTAFSVKYIERFNEMEEQQINFTMPQPTQAELIAMMAQHNVEQERRLNEVEQRQNQLEAKQDNITEIIALNPTEWRKKVSRILSKIAESRGGFEAHKQVRNESYELLEERARCKLNIRIANKQKNLLLTGVGRSTISKVSKIDVIADDTRLTEIYLAIVKEMAIKYGVKAEGLGA